MMMVVVVDVVVIIVVVVVEAATVDIVSVTAMQLVACFRSERRG